MLPHVNMDVPDHQRRRRPYNPCGRVRKLKEKLPWNLMTVQRWFGKSSRRSSRYRRFKGAIGTTSVLIVLLVVLTFDVLIVVLLVVLTFDVLILLKELAELCRPLKAVNSRAALAASFEK